MALTPKQRLFVREYLRDLNATKAAIRAGYSKASATTEGPRLLENVGVREAIDTALEQREQRVEVKADDVLRELMAMAQVDISEAFDEQGRLLPLHEMSPDVRRMIASVETDELYGGSGKARTEIGVIRKVKFWPKDKALELLGRHLKMFTDKVLHEGSVTINVVDPFAAPPKGPPK